jgi:hypothetical protein
MNESMHYVPYAFPTQTIAGGLGRSILQSASMSASHMRVELFTSDLSDYAFGPVAVRAAKPLNSELSAHYTRWWTGTGGWQYIFDAAHTAPVMPKEALKELLPGESKFPHGSVSHLLDYVSRHEASGEVAQAFAERYRHLLESVRPGSNFHWQDFFLLPLMQEYAPKFKEQGVHQTLHIHTVVPKSLPASDWGRQFLNAVASVDRIYVHTELYADRLRLQLDSLGIQAPDIQIFELGVDVERISGALKNVKIDRLRETVPDYEKLTLGQKSLLQDFVATANTVPHRFIDVDRADATKGHLVVLDAIDRFLECRQSDGNSLRDLQEQFRFYFVCKFVDFGMFSNDPHTITAQYGNLVRARFDEMTDKWPTIVQRCDPFGGKQGDVLPILFQNCNLISGASQDGLNLVSMELLVAQHLARNSGEPRPQDGTIICGDGAGFAAEAQRLGFGTEEMFPRAGDSDAFKRSIESVVNRSETERLSHGQELLLPMLNQMILPRKDAVIVNR